MPFIEQIFCPKMALESTGVIIGDTTYINGKEIDEKILFKDYINKDKEVTHQMHHSSIFGILDTEIWVQQKCNITGRYGVNESQPRNFPKSTVMKLITKPMSIAMPYG